MNLERDIIDFHEKYDNIYRGRARQLPEDLQQFRSKFLQEELEEYLQAVAEQNLEKQFDALIDLVYVAIGTAYIQGFPFNDGWKLVHEANMKKVRVKRASDSVRGSVYDVVKPTGWVPPNLGPIIEGTYEKTVD